MPFKDSEKRQPVLLITSTPAWNVAKDQLKDLNIAETIEIIETTTEYWDILEAKTKKRKPENEGHSIQGIAFYFTRKPNAIADISYTKG